MNIWFDPKIVLQDLEKFSSRTLNEFIGIRMVELGEDYLRGTLPVDERTLQAHGILHGGASVVLAETIGSIAANLVVDPQKFYCVGLEINANHVRSVHQGVVTGTARPVHLGKSTQIWEIRMLDDKQRLTCISRLTMAVLAKPV